MDPKHLGLGMYQLDLPASDLEEALDMIVEECVSLVGLDINHAPLHLLKKISGLGPSRALAIIKYRETNVFVSRQQLMEVRERETDNFIRCSWPCRDGNACINAYNFLITLRSCILTDE